MPPANRASSFYLPILAFAGAILAGALVLTLPACQAGESLSFLDALFTATSAVCVTGLIVVDTGSFFSFTGQSVILLLIQLGGIGIITYSTLAFYLLRRRVSLADKVGLGRALRHDESFHLGRFLLLVVLGSLTIESIGALSLHLLDPVGFPAFPALFHAISAYCNAGFALQAESLIPWADDLGVNLVFMALIIVGGLGFAVLLESWRICEKRLRGQRLGARFSLHGEVVLRTSAWLILGGALLLSLDGGYTGAHSLPPLQALFTSVTSRTAGFNTVDIGALSNVSLLALMALMFVGGSPGSCAGGVKTTTLRVVLAFVASQARSREQTTIRRFAVAPETLRTALTLAVFSGGLVILAVLGLNAAEEFASIGGVGAVCGKDHFLDLAFEAVSAFGTVGLSTGITASLSSGSKCILIVLMFLGRLGPILFLSLLASWQRSPRYRRPEETMLIG